MAAGIPGGSYSDQLSQDSRNELGLRQSGTHGQFVNFQTGRGNSQTPSFTDSSGELPMWLGLAAAVIVTGAVVWWLWRKKG